MKTKDISKDESGVSLVELLIVIFILSLIVAGLSEMLAGGLKASRENRSKTALIEDANYAMSRILYATRETNFILIPQVFIPGDPDSIRDILAISAMVDNDNDGAVDEDWSSDIGNDGKPGLAGFDDDGDGSIDEGGGPAQYDDDEDGQADEDVPENGLDDDLSPDGRYDEELRADIDGGRCPPVCSSDDDGDGMVEEDPVDPVIFYIKNGALYEKKILWDPSTGLSDITETMLVDNVTVFRVERMPGPLIRIRLEVSGGRGSSVMLETDIHPRMMPTLTP